MKKIFVPILLLFFILPFVFEGIAEAKDLPPWCTPPIAFGKTKAEITNTWGEPDKVTQAGADETGLKKEVWVYNSKPITQVLAGHSYVCSTFKLTFTGESLTGYEAVEDTASRGTP